MTYTQLAISAVVCAVIFDFLIAKTYLVKRKVFWTSYLIIFIFQLITNWWLTSRNIVIYNSDKIIGVRVASAPIEDLLFGFSLVLGVLANWMRIEASRKQRQQL